jgi:hypothetical protein
VFTDAPKGKRYDRRAWKTISFALGMNRVADFNNSYLYNGTTNKSSGSQVFESDANLVANNVHVQNSLGYMGYQSYLLNENGQLNPNRTPQYQSIVPFAGGVDQQKSKQTNGGITEYLLSLGGNYKEKLMLGVTLAVPVVDYSSQSYFSESLSAGNHATNRYGFQSFNYNQAVDITGGGFNAKIGAIYKLSNAFRIGAAFHTPTWYSLNDVSSPGITTIHSAGGPDSNSTLSVYDGSLVTNSFDYGLTIPWKGVLSATFMIGKLGFVSADYEFVDYTSMKYTYPRGIDSNTGIPYQAEADQVNQQIKKIYKPASNFRLGAEILLSHYFMVRAGAGYYGNAYSAYGESKESGYHTTQRIDLSLGLGFHFHQFFTDVACVHGIYQGYEQPYSINNAGAVTPVAIQDIPTAKVSYNTNNVALTIGMKFDNGGSRRRTHRRPESEQVPGTPQQGN